MIAKGLFYSLQVHEKLRTRFDKKITANFYRVISCAYNNCKGLNPDVWLGAFSDLVCLSYSGKWNTPLFLVRSGVSGRTLNFGAFTGLSSYVFQENTTSQWRMEYVGPESQWASRHGGKHQDSHWRSENQPRNSSRTYGVIYNISVTLSHIESSENWTSGFIKTVQ